MIPTNPGELPAEFRDYYERVRTEDAVVLATNEVRLAQLLADEGLGFGGGLSPGKRFWPLHLHANATFLQGRHGWVNEVYAEISFCRTTGCKCSDITWLHCGERLATFYGAVLRLEKEDPTRGSLLVYDHAKCAPGSSLSGPAVGQIDANNPGHGGHRWPRHAIVRNLRRSTPVEHGGRRSSGPPVRRGGLRPRSGPPPPPPASEAAGANRAGGADRVALGDHRDVDRNGRRARKTTDRARDQWRAAGRLAGPPSRLALPPAMPGQANVQMRRITRRRRPAVAQSASKDWP